MFTVDTQAEDKAAKVTESQLFFNVLPKQSCIILIPEPSFCQGIMGNLICSTLELKMGKTILHGFCLLQVKNKVFFEFLISRLQIKRLSTEAITVYILLYTYNKALLQQKKVFS